MIKSSFLFLIFTTIIFSCKKTNGPLNRDCTLTNIISNDSIEIKLQYSGDKLIKEETYAYRSGNKLLYKEYEYQSSEVIKKVYDSFGTPISVAKYLLDANENVILYTNNSFSSLTFDIYDTTHYYYDSKGYLTSSYSNEYYIYTNPQYNHQYTSNAIYSYPSTGFCNLSISYDQNPPTTKTIEFYTHISPNTSSIHYAPFYYGKSDFMLEKVNGSQTYTYTFDLNKNVVGRLSSIKDTIYLKDKYIYDCQ